MWPNGMGYLDTYDQLFTPLRDEPINVLELGWGEYSPERGDHSDPNKGGRSARMWRTFFSKANIHVIDIEHKVNTVEGVTLHQGDQTDVQLLNDISETVGPWSIIVDDASHISSAQITSFKALWPHLTPGGFYCIEDIGMSAYHPWYYGESEADENPRTDRPTIMNFLKSLTDEVHYSGTRKHGPARNGSRREFDMFPSEYWQGYRIDSITFRYNLCVITKASTPQS